MWVDCPECGAGLEGISGAENVCPACMTPFLVPASARAVRAFDVQPAGEAVLHGLSRYAIREAIYVGRFTAAARVRPVGAVDGGHAAAATWELMGGYPEFASVFRLLGGDLAPMAGTRKLAGWKQSGAAPAELSSPRLPRLPLETSASVVIPALEAPSAPEDLVPTRAEPLPSASRPSAPRSSPARPSPARPPPAVAAGSGAALYLVGGLVLVALIAAAVLLT